MHRFGAARFAGGDDLVDHQITFRRLRRSDSDGGVGHRHMQRVLVGVGKDGDGLDPHFARGLDDPAGNFAAIGNQNTLEHCLELGAIAPGWAMREKVNRYPRGCYTTVLSTAYLANIR